MFTGLCSIAVIAEVHARLAEGARWALNEKAVATRAGLQGAERELRRLGSETPSMQRSLAALRHELQAP
jgi:hypothetical protein